MLDTIPRRHLQEINASEELRKRHLVNCNRLIRRIVGNHYRSDMKTSPVPENMIYSYVATLLPQIVFDNPAVTVSAKRAVSHRPIAEYMAMALNGWIKEVRLRDELEPCWRWTCSSASAAARWASSRAATTAASTPAWRGASPCRPSRPSPCGSARAASSSTARLRASPTARILGHRFQRDLSDLQQDERYDAAAVKGLSADDERHGHQPARDQPPPQPGRTGTRDRVTLYELYFPETRQIGTLALYAPGRGENAAWVRPLSDYKGPETGPYEFFGVYIVPDQVYPLSPIAAMADQEKELNAHAAAAAEEASAPQEARCSWTPTSRTWPRRSRRPATGTS